MSKNYQDWKKQIALLSDDALIERTEKLVSDEREVMAWLVAHLAEMFRRDLALKRGKGSIYLYAHDQLGLTDGEAWKRGNAACLALEMPETIERLASGELSLTSASDLWSALRSEQEAAKRAIKKPEARPAIPPAQTGFELPQGHTTPPPAPTPPPPVSSSEKKEIFLKVLGKTCNEAKAVLRDWKEERSPDPAPTPVRPQSTRRRAQRGWTELSFFLNDAELAEFDRLRDLLSHKLRTRDTQAVFAWMLGQALEQVDPVRKQDRVERRRARRAQTEAGKPALPLSQPTDALKLKVSQPVEDQKNKPPAHAPDPKAARPSSEKETPRRKPIPAELKRRVFIRDESKCQFTDPKTGTKCGSTAYLDLDHRLDVSQGGENTEDQLVLACSNHNRRRYQWGPEDQPTYAIQPVPPS